MEENQNHLKRVIEALLFASSEPIPFKKIRAIIDGIEPTAPNVIQDLLDELKQEYIALQRAFRLEEIANGFVLSTCEAYAPYVAELYRNKRGEKLSQASLEVLSIIAYRQPITRPQIELIRGVDCSSILYQLIERGLIESQGKLEAPGRPTLYGVTEEFLKHFGLRNTGELPHLKSFDQEATVVNHAMPQNGEAVNQSEHTNDNTRGRQSDPIDSQNMAR